MANMESTPQTVLFYSFLTFKLHMRWDDISYSDQSPVEIKGKQNKSHKNADLPSLRNFPCFTSAMPINRIYPLKFYIQCNNLHSFIHSTNTSSLFYTVLSSIFSGFRVTNLHNTQLFFFYFSTYNCAFKTYFQACPIKYELEISHKK